MMLTLLFFMTVSAVLQPLAMPVVALEPLAMLQSIPLQSLGADPPQPAPQVAYPAPQTPAIAATVAANAANAAANAAQAAAVAADTAADAAANANVAANAAATATVVAATANTAATEVASVSGDMAKTAAAVDVAASAKTAANAAASANEAANTAAQAATNANMAAYSAASAALSIPAVVAPHIAPAVNAVTTEAVSAVLSAPAHAPAIVEPLASVVAPVKLVRASKYWSTSQWYIMQMRQLILGLSFAMAVKGLCVMGNVLVQISPFPQVKRWGQRGCTGDADSAPYVSIAFGGFQWCFYGLFAYVVTSRSGFLVLVHSNCLGAVLGTYYVRAFYCNCRNEESLGALQKYLSAVSTLVLLQVCSMCILPAERALFLTGLISSFCSFIGATSVLVTVPMVFRTKDSRSIPGPFAVANCASAIVWSLCGYLLDDPLVMVPNLFSVFCSGTSIGLKVFYPSDVFSSGGAEKLEEGMEAKGKKAALVCRRAVNVPTEFTPIQLATSKNASPTFMGSFMTTCQQRSTPVGAGDDGADGTGGTC